LVGNIKAEERHAANRFSVTRQLRYSLDETKIKLDEICKIIGLPGKPSGIDGSEVEEMIQAGRLAEVAQYCESDVLNTYRLWLVYELFRGATTREQLAFSEAQAVNSSALENLRTHTC
jgi:predicted PolB exonuclease-like 3'-5' exonuclease